MRLTVSVFLSWLFVTVVYLTVLHLDGIQLSMSYVKGIAILWLLVGFPILYFLFKLKKINRAWFVGAGIMASIPMLALCIVARETEWIVATAIAGIGGGAVFALILPNQPRT
ncbi:hypothetical protein MO867_22035 [Microbulbifer sp. OS29]|uniref:Uncharacterized protein n=1 Tax=Microbulbifer okhotskensis TaxID=2926617 RepID=A0A9X2ERG2_9GAMM|nr:hypothetical protein [Microbulbifer okhotskensis]MCO1337007.1 hypothetical protein [Microbulbifer okhotskensis]